MTRPRPEAKISRRRLLATTAAFMLSGTRLLRAETISGSVPWSPNAADPPVPVRPGPWQFFSTDEVELVEALIERLIPEDELGPGGVEAGCAVFLDRQLAGPYGRSEGLYLHPPFLKGLPTQGYQGAHTPNSRYREGLAALAAHMQTHFAGKKFKDLTSQDQDKLLTDMESGALQLDGVESKEFFALFWFDVQKGFFADPVYGGNKDMIGWKMIGFPGARYDYRDWVTRHNEPYPYPPVGIMGRVDWNVSQ